MPEAHPKGSAPGGATAACKFERHECQYRSRAFRDTTLAFLVGVLASGLASYIWTLRVAPRLTTITIPVFIRGQDAQGGQFALGVSRAIEHVSRYGLDEIGGQRIKPLFLNEDLARDPAGLELLKKRVRDVGAPIVVGPLTSTDANALVRPIAGEQQRPMILGIPTAMNAANGGEGRVWRISPKNDRQAQVVADLYARIRSRDDRLMIISDESGDNNDYASDLVPLVRQEITRVYREAKQLSDVPNPYTVKTDGDYATINAAFRNPETRPTTVILVGMPTVATDLINASLEPNVDLHANWILTDGCVSSERALLKAASEIAARGKACYITFQSPPPKDSKGLQRYIWYVRNIGGRVSSAVESLAGRSANDPKTYGKCDEELSAPSYEVFGYDSYLMAVKLVTDASAFGKISPATVEKAMAGNSVTDPFFLLGRRATAGDVKTKSLATYTFDKGDSKDLTFHVYSIHDGCVEKAMFPNSTP